MPALSQSDLAKGRLTTAPDAETHTFALSSHAIAALPQSARVKGWGATSSAKASVATRLPIIRNARAKSFIPRLLEYRLSANAGEESFSALSSLDLCRTVHNPQQHID